MKYISWLLFALHFFVAITALGGGYNLVTTNGGGLPIYYLYGSPFSSYIIPGIVLIVIVGGTQLLAAFALLRKMRFQYELSAIAAFGLLLWIYIQISLIHQTSFLQSVYFGLGIGELVCIILLLANSQKKQT